jgi:group I intron endonuclease
MKQVKRPKSGIYCIKNILTKKKYIGSSIDCERRYLTHISRLRRNSHCNKHLQYSFNKYGEKVFKFSIIKTCKKNLKKHEQFYIDNNDFKQMYNIALHTVGPGTSTSKSYYLLDSDKNIVSEHFSGSSIAKLFGKRQIDYSMVNKDAYHKNLYTKEKYRVVEKEYYHKNLDYIKTWSKASNIAKIKERKRTRRNNMKYTIVLPDNTIKYEKSYKKVSEYFDISYERIRQLLNKQDIIERKGIVAFKTILKD